MLQEAIAKKILKPAARRPRALARCRDTGTKIVGAALASVALLSCATKPVITAQDYKSGAFTVCGSPQASKDDLSQRAVKACTGATPLKVLRCTVDARYSTVGIEGEVTVSGNCCDYTCRPIGAP